MAHEGSAHLYLIVEQQVAQFPDLGQNLQYLQEKDGFRFRWVLVQKCLSESSEELWLSSDWRLKGSGASSSGFCMSEQVPVWI